MTTTYMFNIISQSRILKKLFRATKIQFWISSLLFKVLKSGIVDQHCECSPASVILYFILKIPIFITIMTQKVLTQSLICIYYQSIVKTFCSRISN